MFKLKCPKCNNSMNYSPISIVSEKTRKTCVYCGKSFKIIGNRIKE